MSPGSKISLLPLDTFLSLPFCLLCLYVCLSLSLSLSEKIIKTNGPCERALFIHRTHGLEVEGVDHIVHLLASAGQSASLFSLSHFLMHAYISLSFPHACLNVFLEKNTGSNLEMRVARTHTIMRTCTYARKGKDVRNSSYLDSCIVSSLFLPPLGRRIGAWPHFEG